MVPMTGRFYCETNTKELAVSLTRLRSLLSPAWSPLIHYPLCKMYKMHFIMTPTLAGYLMLCKENMPPYFAVSSFIKSNN